MRSQRSESTPITRAPRQYPDQTLSRAAGRLIAESMHPLMVDPA